MDPSTPAPPLDARYPHTYPLGHGHFPLYLTSEDAIRLGCLCSVSSTLTLTARMRRFDGTVVPMTMRLDTSANLATLASVAQCFGDGWLLGLSVKVTSGSAAVGATWVVVDVVRGASSVGTVLQSLAMGYVTSFTPLLWPGGVAVAPCDGPGKLRTILGATPAAGAEVSETVPTGARWELISFAGVLTTAVAVANRRPTLAIDDGANIYGQFDQVTVVTASLTSRNTWGQGLVQFQSGSSAFLVSGFPANQRLGAGHRLRTVTTGIQAADQWGTVVYLVREWLTGE